MTSRFEGMSIISSKKENFQRVIKEKLLERVSPYDIENLFSYLLTTDPNNSHSAPIKTMELILSLAT